MTHFRNLSLLALTLAFTAACNNKSAPTTPNYAGAINTYYQTHPACLWTSEKQFPVQSSPDDAKTEGYDALVDAGLLTRSTSEKKMVIISKRENNYDLSQNGRQAWTADPNQPGFGNFCYGTRKVSTIDSNSQTSNQPGATVTVNYHYTLTNVPSWAQSQETQTAFPSVKDNLSGPQTATATLTNTNSGWQVSSAPGSSSNGATSSDGKIVQ